MIIRNRYRLDLPADSGPCYGPDREHYNVDGGRLLGMLCDAASKSTDRVYRLAEPDDLDRVRETPTVYSEATFGPVTVHSVSCRWLTTNRYTINGQPATRDDAEHALGALVAILESNGF